MTKLQMKQAELKVLESLFDSLDYLERDTTTEFKKIGKKTTQAVDRNDELLWEDAEKTIPKYEDEYDYVPIPDDKLTDNRLAILEGIRAMRKHLETLL